MVETWIRERYVPRHPAPPREPHLTAQVASSHGFEVVGSAELGTAFVMNIEEFADYLLTQSNALAALQSGRTTDDQLRAAILEDLEPLFPASKVGTAVFRVRALCSRRSAGEQV